MKIKKKNGGLFSFIWNCRILPPSGSLAEEPDDLL
jgi:hypothetical protein